MVGGSGMITGRLCGLKLSAAGVRPCLSCTVDALPVGGGSERHRGMDDSQTMVRVRGGGGNGHWAAKERS